MLVKLSSCLMPPVRKNKSNICFKQASSVCLCVKGDGVIVHTCLYTVTVLICVLLQLTLCVNSAGGFAFPVNVCGRVRPCSGTKRPAPHLPLTKHIPQKQTNHNATSRLTLNAPSSMLNWRKSILTWNRSITPSYGG